MVGQSLDGVLLVSLREVWGARAVFQLCLWTEPWNCVFQVVFLFFVQQQHHLVVKPENVAQKRNLIFILLMHRTQKNDNGFLI